MIRVHFYKPTDWVGRAIAWLTKSPYCHVAIEHTLLGHQFLTQAHADHGVFAMRYQKPGDYVFEIPEVGDSFAFEWLSKKWGIAYGYEDIVTFMAKSRFWKRRNSKGLICSELAVMFLAAVFRAVEVAPKWEATARMVCAATDSNPSHVSPGDLWAMMMKSLDYDRPRSNAAA